MKSTTSDQFTFFAVNSEKDGSTADGARAIVILNQNFKWQIASFASSKYICTFAMEIEVDTVECSVVRSEGRANSVAFVLSTHPATIDTDALVAVTSDSGSWVEFFTAKLTWALVSLETLAVMKVLSFWAMATINAMIIIAVV